MLDLEDGPVEEVVVLVPLPDEQVPEQLAQVVVVRLVLEAQGAADLEVGDEFGGEALAEDLHGGGHLALADLLVLLLLGVRLQALPGQGAPQEVH